MDSPVRAVPLLLVAASVASLLCIASPGEGIPLYAARQGLKCQNCHFDPNGGGPRNEFGFAYARNRHSTEAETQGAFKDLNLVNKVSDSFPLYLGVNQRLMSLADDAGDNILGLDRFGFYSMETAIHMAFQPHPRLTLVYTQDGFASSSRKTREAWGMLGLCPDWYLRAGRFRVPFGLRMDDHTVATRNAFVEFQNPGRSILPYDPREPDEGMELGGSHGNMSGRVAFTNGTTSVLGLNGGARLHSQTVSAKLGMSTPSFEYGLSGYDEYEPAAIAGDRVRASRWGYYAFTHRGNASLIAEVVAGTDHLSPASAGALDRRRNVMGAFGEVDYQFNRAYNMRVRYDRLEGDRASDPTVREQSSFNRYAIEGEFVPVPFAEIRWTARLIDPVAATFVGGAERKNEKQGYIQVHFSY